MRFPRFIAALALLVACDDGTGPSAGAPSTLTLVAGDSVVVIGTPLDVDASLRDASGRTIADVEVAFETSDATVALVSADGVVTGVAIGYADVIARAGELTDTLRVRVRDDAVPLMNLRVRFGRGPDAVTRTHGGFMRFYDTMGNGSGDEAGLRSQPSDVARDTVLAIVFPGDAHEGRRAIDAYPLDGAPSSGVIALLRLGSAESGDLEYWASVDTGWIDLDIDEPPAPGWRMGVARGFFHLPLVKLAPVPGAPPVLTSDTLWLHGEVHVHDQHVLRGWADVMLLDGPVVGTSVFGQAFGDEDDRGGYIFGWDADLDGLGSGPGRWEVSQELRVVGPGVGSFELPRFTGDAFADPDLWPDRFSSVFYRDEARIPLVTEGMLHIDRWTAPTLEDYGVIQGTIDARFELWTPDLTAPTGDTVRVVSQFAAPISPLAGLPAAPPAPDDLHPTF